MEQALADMTGVAKQLEIQYPGSNRDQGASVMPLYEEIVGDIRPLLLVLLSGSRIAAVDCVRECGKLVAGKVREPKKGDCSARCAGCFAGTIDSAVHYGRCRIDCERKYAWTAGCLRWNDSAQPTSLEGHVELHALSGRDWIECSHADFYWGDFATGGGTVRGHSHYACAFDGNAGRG